MPEIAYFLITVIKQSIETQIGACSLWCAGVAVFLLLIIRVKNLMVLISLNLLLISSLVGFSFSSLQQIQAAIPYSDGVSNSDSDDKITNHRIIDINNNVTKILQTKNGVLIDQDTSNGYIFVGRFHHDRWQDSLFDEPKGLLKFGDELVLTKRRDVYQCAPYRKQTFDLKYTFCDQIGSSAKNSRVRISRSPVIIGVDNVWVYIEALPKKRGVKKYKRAPDNLLVAGSTKYKGVIKVL